MEKKNKSKKIVVGIIFLIIAIAMAVVLCIGNKPEKEYENVYLEDVEFSKEMEEVSEVYVNNGMSAVDENGRKVNINEELSYEKFILDAKVGMYDFSIVSDFEQSKLTYTVKNHTKEKIEKFAYTLVFLNVDGSVMGKVKLESDAIPALSKYKVTVNINSDVADVYTIMPVIEDEELGGEYIEE